MIRQSEITWVLSKAANEAVEPFRANSFRYRQLKDSFRILLTAYFNAHNTCGAGQSATINPIGVTENGAKILKVRLGMPGRGKSGSLRLEVLVYCQERKVLLNQVLRRDQNPEF